MAWAILWGMMLLSRGTLHNSISLTLLSDRQLRGMHRRLTKAHTCLSEDTENLRQAAPVTAWHCFALTAALDVQA